MIYLRSFFLILLSSCLHSQDNNCIKQPTSNDIKTRDGKIISDTIPLAERNYQIITKQLGLDNLSQSSVAEQYRFWFEDFQNEEQVMILIKNENGQWRGARYSFTTERNDNFEIIKTRFSLQTANPKSENAAFQEKIDHLEINKFRDSEEIEGYSYCMGSYGIVLEFVKFGKYHKCLYPCWNTVSPEIKEIKGLSKIIGIFKTEFGFDVE